MSYAHYWQWEVPIVDRGRFAQWSQDVGILLAHYPSYAHWLVEKTSSPTSFFEDPSPYKICGPSASGEPILTGSEVAFNGNEASHNSGEPFCLLHRDLAEPRFSGGCSTLHQPYDLLVTAALVRLASYFPEIRVSSDGGIAGLQLGTRLCCDIFGAGVNPELQRLLGVSAPNDAHVFSTLSAVPDLAFLPYILAWYCHLHPQQAVRTATLQARVLAERPLASVSRHPLCCDIWNDSLHSVWNVYTGKPFEIVTPVYGLSRFGSDFPAADFLTAEAGRLANQWRGTSFHLGAPENDPPLKQEACWDQPCSIYFRDGSIMLVRIPTQITRKSENTVPVKGMIEYSMRQTRMQHEMEDQVIEKEAYRAIYHTLTPQLACSEV